MTHDEVRQRRTEYGMSQDVVAHFADVSNATVSKYERGLLDITDGARERIETAVWSMANIAHYYNEVPIRWSDVTKFESIVRRGMAEHRAARNTAGGAN